MKLNKLLIALSSAIVIVGFSLYFFTGDYKNGSKNEAEEQQMEFVPEVEAVIRSKTDIFRPILSNKLIIEEVKASNQKNKDLTPEEILELDEKFRKSNGNDNFAEQFSTNRAAKELIEFQENNPVFSEIFITDKFGLNVAQTNKTTDYYQADEEWWMNAYNDDKGKEYHGSIEFDESAQAEAISVYIPIIDRDTNEIIGISKAVLSIAAIKLEL